MTDIIVSIAASLIERAVILVILISVQNFKKNVIVFIGIKRHNVTPHWPIFSSIKVIKLILSDQITDKCIQNTKLPSNTQIYCHIFHYRTLFESDVKRKVFFLHLTQKKSNPHPTKPIFTYIMKWTFRNKIPLFVKKWSRKNMADQEYRIL